VKKKYTVTRKFYVFRKFAIISWFPVNYTCAHLEVTDYKVVYYDH